MCVFKYHAFIFCMRPPRWRSETLTTTFIYIYTGYAVRGTIPLLLSPLADSLFAPHYLSLYLLGNPPRCDRIRPPWSQVACKLTSLFSTLPNPSPLQIPRTPDIKRLTMTTSRTWLLLSGTDCVTRLEKPESCIGLKGLIWIWGSWYLKFLKTFL